ncbi:hypothetical protein [Bradyrhizobium sp. Bra64]|uniref:hypothetical protein n=1 Tax=Bradyrhizobium sp. Bra64 TaxID=2926009 RepID=UPI0021174E50|nr:hypothetical protein [Bradyrhizobium sp. Bra64]
MMTPSSDGTLIVIAASQDGLTIASDSRQTLGQDIYCDDAEKVLVPSKPNRFLVAVTGRRGFYPIAINAHVHDICAYVASTQRELDIGEIARTFVEETAPDVDLRKLNARELAQRCIDALIAYFTTNPYWSPAISGQGFSSSVVIASYDPETAQAFVRTIEISSSADLKQLITTDKLNEVFGLDDIAEPILCGEGDYLRLHVLPTINDQSVSQTTKDQVGDFPRVSFPKVRDATVENSISLAGDLVASASKMTASVPAASGIGGRTIIWRIGSDPRPFKLKG